MLSRASSERTYPENHENKLGKCDPIRRRKKLMSKLEKHMADRHYKVILNDWELQEKELHYPSGHNDIKIVMN